MTSTLHDLNNNDVLPFKLIYEDEFFVAIDKPPGFHVHPPENKRWKIPRQLICLYWLRDHLKHYVYPIHRLDAATGGILIFGKNSEAAGKIQEIIQSQKMNKNYLCVCRGFTLKQDIIDKPLLSDSSDQWLPSLTELETLASMELPHSVGKKHSTARYSLVKAIPKTGRYHQIRRHLASTAHPIIGDIKHGDSHHNRFFREELKISGLLLHSYELSFQHPFSKDFITIKINWSEQWKRIFSLFNFNANL